tara:strand:- start:221 stop:652 length:432 start_codon:yes stop_codon:yes gene_type:complete
MKYCTRKVEFDAGHRVHGHESKCARLHGHRYVVEITAAAPELDSIGRVIDFSVLKEVIGGWIDEEWDHRLLLWEGDSILYGIEIDNLGVVYVPFNPTAENMAKWLLHHSNRLLGEAGKTEVVVRRIRVYETPNCWSEYEETNE